MKAQLTADYIRLLEIKKELLAKLLDAVKRAVQMLWNNDIDAFNNEMDRSAEMMSMVDELESSRAGLKGQILDPHQTEIVRLESDIEYILNQIELTRRECNDLAKQRLEDFSRQIRVIRHTKKGIDGYSNQLQAHDAFFVDAKK